MPHYFPETGDHGTFRTYIDHPTEHDTRAGMLKFDKNCVAMALSKCLGVNLDTTVGFLVSQKWIASGKDLENDTKFEAVLKKLGMAEVMTSLSWADAKVTFRGMPDGRYFCVNTKGKDKGADGHAFAVVKNGGLGVAGNNQEKKGETYGSQIRDTDKVTVWGPAVRRA